MYALTTFMFDTLSCVSDSLRGEFEYFFHDWGSASDGGKFECIILDAYLMWYVVQPWFAERGKLEEARMDFYQQVVPAIRKLFPGFKDDDTVAWEIQKRNEAYNAALLGFAPHPRLHELRGHGHAQLMAMFERVDGVFAAFLGTGPLPTVARRQLVLKSIIGKILQFSAAFYESNFKLQ